MKNDSLTFERSLQPLYVLMTIVAKSCILFFLISSNSKTVRGLRMKSFVRPNEYSSAVRLQSWIGLQIVMNHANNRSC